MKINLERVIIGLEAFKDKLTPCFIKRREEAKHKQEISLKRRVVKAYREINASQNREHLMNCKRFISTFIEPFDSDGSITRRLLQEVKTRSLELKVYI